MGDREGRPGGAGERCPEKEKRGQGVTGKDRAVPPLGPRASVTIT